MQPEVLFVVASAKRPDNVNQALDEWRRAHVGQTFPMRALTLSDAGHDLRGLIGAPPRITEERTLRPPPPPSLKPREPPLLTSEDFQILSRCHRDFIDIVHRQHDLHRSIIKSGKTPQFPFEPYPTNIAEAGKVLEQASDRR